MVLIHGPGGIGKTALLREAARRAGGAFEPFWVEGLELPPYPSAVEDALDGARGAERPLVLIDNYERMTALGGYLRRQVLPALPENTIVLIAGRTRPEAGWFEGGWESLCVELELGGLSRGESLELVGGVPDAEKLVSWAAGSPLALMLAAEAGTTGDDVMQALIERLAEDDLHGPFVPALEVAAIARVATPEMLADVLPGLDAWAWLAQRSFAEPVGDGLALHELARQALVADLKRRDPELEKELRRKIADHLYERAIGGRLLLSIDLAHLTEDPVIRWGYGWPGPIVFRIDDVREGDIELIEPHVREARDDAWWHGMRRYFTESPDRVGIARNSADDLAGFEISMTPGNAPDFAWEDPLLGPWLEHASANAPGGNAVVWHDSVNMQGGIQTGVRAVLAPAGMLRSGLANPRFAYMPINREVEGSVEFSAALGAEHVSELDCEVPGAKLVECHVVDWGEGGLLGFQRDTIYRELGLEPASLGARDALRAARDGTLAEAGCDELWRATEHAFGDTPAEELLREIVVKGYLEPSGSHESLADDMHLSRAAYFRRLRQASERLAEYLGK